MDNDKTRWKYDAEKRIITLYANGDYHLGTADFYYTIKVEVGGQDGRKNVPETGGSETQ